LKTPDIIRELEEHLRDDFDQQIWSGVSESKAFQAALQRIGQPSVLRNEFALAGQTGMGETRVASGFASPPCVRTPPHRCSCRRAG
ncbi:MAG: permease prefix domain 1-containing protein, partial [Opitutaceae bacterium]